MDKINTTLSKSAQRVQDALAKNSLDFKVLELPASTRTANEAAETIGCQVAQIIKSLIFKTKNTNKPILILASGLNRVNEKVIEGFLGEALTKADANFTKQVTGYAIGGIPPVGHKQVIETFIDEDLLNYEELWAAAGTPNAVFKLDSKDLVNLSHAKVVAIK